MLNHLKLKHPTSVTSTAQTGAQRTLDTFIVPSSSRQCPPSRANAITEMITDMIAIDMLPISFVKGTGFRRLLRFVEPSYIPCARKLVTSRLEKKYGECATDTKAGDN